MELFKYMHDLEKNVYIVVIKPAKQILKSPVPYPLLGISLSFWNEQRYASITNPAQS